MQGYKDVHCPLVAAVIYVIAMSLLRNNTNFRDGAIAVSILFAVYSSILMFIGIAYYNIEIDELKHRARLVELAGQHIDVKIDQCELNKGHVETKYIIDGKFEKYTFSNTNNLKIEFAYLTTEEEVLKHSDTVKLYARAFILEIDESFNIKVYMRDFEI